MYTLKTYEELEKIVNDWLNDDGDDTGEVHHSTPSSKSSSDPANPSSKYKSLDEAFADLEDL